MVAVAAAWRAALAATKAGGRGRAISGIAVIAGAAADALQQHLHADDQALMLLRLLLLLRLLRLGRCTHQQAVVPSDGSARGATASSRPI
jgi:hypothetical protein